MLAFLAVLAGLYRAQTRRPMVFAPGAAPYGQPQMPGYPPGVNPGGYPMAQQPGMGGGSGLMGTLGAGLAAGAGFAVGETLVDKLFDHGATSAGQGGILPSSGSTSDAPVPDDQNFGLTDVSSWSDDSSADAGGADGSWSDSRAAADLLQRQDRVLELGVMRAVTEHCAMLAAARHGMAVTP
uniref:Uncharacterized protein n=1 Tax=mine drainage metagenome TaxID=410659 RepID=E6PQQ2_9ZZZZ